MKRKLSNWSLKIKCSQLTHTKQNHFYTSTKLVSAFTKIHKDIVDNNQFRNKIKHLLSDKNKQIEKIKVTQFRLTMKNREVPSFVFENTQFPGNLSVAAGYAYHNSPWEFWVKNLRKKEGHRE